MSIGKNKQARFFPIQQKKKFFFLFAMQRQQQHTFRVLLYF